MNSDNLFYFMAAIDQSLGHTSKSIFAFNDGWPSFLSLFFWILQSNNFMDYMTLQKILTVGISVVYNNSYLFFRKNNLLVNHMHY